MKDFKMGTRVVYVPYHAHGDVKHKDCEHGIVTSINEETKTIFVRFGSMVTSQGCSADQLVIE
jgi:hypothetical protein